MTRDEFLSGHVFRFPDTPRNFLYKYARAGIVFEKEILRNWENYCKVDYSDEHTAVFTGSFCGRLQTEAVDWDELEFVL